MMVGYAATMAVGDAHADVTVPIVVDTGSTPTVDPAITLGTAKRAACTPQGIKDDFDTQAGALEATVNTSPLGPTIQYVWDTYDGLMGGLIGGSASAWVPDTGCAQGVEVTWQLTDTSAAPGCRAAVPSQVFSSYGNVHAYLGDGTPVLVGINPDRPQLPVTYYGNDGTAGAAGVVAYCARTASVVTVTTNGYYRNNLNQMVWFACERAEYQVLASPRAPQITYAGTSKC